MKRAGHRVGVLAPEHRSLRLLKQKTPYWPRGESVEDDAGVSLYQHHSWAWFFRVPYANQYRWLRAGERLFERYVREHGRPDIVHAHSVLNAGLLAARLKARFEIPAVLTEHSSAFAWGMVRGWQENGVRRALVAMDSRLVVSPELGRLLEAKYGVAAKPWLWVPNMVDTEFFSPAPQDRTTPTSQPFTFLTISLLRKKKGHVYLLEAFARRFVGDPNVRLRIGGGGLAQGRLERRAGKLGISGQVEFLGLLDRAGVRDEMRSCDCFVLPSLYENCPVVLIEALACGKPVIATRSGGPKSIVKDGDGALVPARDVEALGEAMLRMRVEAVGFDPERIRAGCVARFDEAVVAGMLTKVYEKVLGRWHER